MELEAYRTMAATEDAHWWFCGRRAIAESVIRTLGLPTDARILEIGAGTGGNLPMLSQFGMVTAVEMNDVARTIAREKTGRDFLSGHLPDGLTVAGQRFDLICLFDVLEHVSADQESLRVIRSLLAPGGRVVLTVPAHQWMWSAHDEQLHHFRRYSRSLLKERIEAAGFSIDRLSFTNAALFPVAALARVADRMLKSSTPSGHALPVAPLNAAMKAIFSIERHLVSTTGLPFGVSLLAVFRDASDVASDRLAA